MTLRQRVVPTRDEVGQMLVMFGSIAGAAVIFTAVFWAGDLFMSDPATAESGGWAAVAILAFILVDFRLFRYLVDRFDVTPPEEFREVGSDE